MWKDKKILLCITGSIAAYKAILLIRLLVKRNAEVKVIMTSASKDFVSPVVLSTLSKNKVLSLLADEDTWAKHVMLGRWADVMLVAPLSCNSLSKMAHGICDNLVMAAYLSATCPIVVAPAMDEDMWHHPSTQQNIATLENFGNKVISVGKGELGSGLFGEGRMAEPEEIITFVEETLLRTSVLTRKKVLITAGPTYEAIDPVRFIGNHSSGKMGIALAEQFYLAGADVHLICGPSQFEPKYRGITIKHVVTAEEMCRECESVFSAMDIAILSAAVADYKPERVAVEKIKKNTPTLNFELIKTIDILQYMGAVKLPTQLLIGFALETNNEKENALKKLRLKNADFIVLNSLKDEKAGFGKDTNKVTIFDKEGNEYKYGSKSKAEVATDILNLIIQKL